MSAMDTERDESQLSAPPPSEGDSDSSSDSSDGETEVADRTQWLATTRERRSTAGNRMKSMLTNEEPDSDLELLFAEDENDQGFTDAGEDASDVQMDSSSSDEDENNVAGDLEGEMELERQARERRVAQRKRKAQDAIPAKFRKRARLDPAASDTSTPAPTPAPRPKSKKKSERTSWLPSAADLPTRASSRKTTRMSKEQLHQQMIEREEKRLKQLAQMQKKAAKMEALKKPPMTQEDRLREAAIVEKRNSKSLNRWEVAEKQREEERKAKLAALHQRTLKGPVVTFWSGIGEARRVIVEEEKPKKRREKADKAKDKTNANDGVSQEQKGASPPTGELAAAQPSRPDLRQQQKSNHGVQPPTAAEPKVREPMPEEKPAPLETQAPQHSQPYMPPPAAATSSSSLGDDNGQQRPRLMAMPLAAPASAPPPQASPGIGGARPLETSKPSGVLAAPVLAPPPSLGVDYRPSTNPKSNVLAPPNTSHHHGPGPAPPIQGQTPAPASDAATAGAEPDLRRVFLQPVKNEAAPTNNTASPILSGPPSAPSASVSTPDLTATRNAIIFQNFDENAIKDRTVQTQILFGRKMNKLSKPSPSPICVITNLPARYHDPKTGLPYYNAYAYREIQRLGRGEHRWSKILNAWVGCGKTAARGVPERFLNPNAPCKTAEEKPLQDKPAQDKEMLSQATTDQPQQPQQQQQQQQQPVALPAAQKQHQQIQQLPQEQGQQQTQPIQQPAPQEPPQLQPQPLPIQETAPVQ